MTDLPTPAEPGATDTAAPEPGDTAPADAGAADAPTPAPNRAGRDLRAAIGVGLLLGALVVGSLVLDARAFLAVVTAAVAYGAWEVRRALTAKDIHVPVLPLMIGTVAMLVSAYARGAEALVLTFGLTMVGLLVWRIADGLAGAARDLAGGALVAFYPVFLAGFASLMLAEEDGRQRIILFILVTVFSDIGGYAAGATLGRHPMAPSLSPKKSWVKKGSGQKILTGCLYRKGNSSEENNRKLIDIVNKVWDIQNGMLIAGDLNYPNIDWRTHSTSNGDASLEQLFLDTIEDNFLTCYRNHLSQR